MNGLTFDVDGTTYTNDYIYKVANVTANTFTIEVPVGSTLTITGVYTGGGQIQVLNNFDIKTKNFGFFQEQGKKTNLTDLDILLSRTSLGEFTLNLYQDFNDSETIAPLTGDSTVRTRPEDDDNFGANQDKIWHEVKRGVLADTFQLQFTLSDAQMRNTDIQASLFDMGDAPSAPVDEIKVPTLDELFEIITLIQTKNPDYAVPLPYLSGRLNLPSVLLYHPAGKSQGPKGPNISGL